MKDEAKKPAAEKKVGRGKNRGRQPNGDPHPIDTHVGHRLRAARTLVGLSQDKLGQQISLTFQQVQKYERGANRIGASRLFDLACILGVPVGYFFEDIPEEMKQASVAERLTTSAMGDDEEKELLYSRETLEMLRYYYKTPEPMRRKLFDLLKTTSQSTLAADVNEMIEDSAK